MCVLRQVSYGCSGHAGSFTSGPSSDDCNTMSNVTVIGGSIAGCLAALVLGRRGYDAQVFERSDASLVDRGAAVGIPAALFVRLKNDDLIDGDTPHISHKTMRYFHASKERGDLELLTLPTDIVALRWGHLYQQLRKRIPDDRYQQGVAVRLVEEMPEQVVVTLSNGDRVSSELAVAADGASSHCRTMVCGPVQQKYSGYVLWRGLLPEQQWVQPANSEGIQWSLFDKGLAGAYFIANEAGHSEPGNRTLNWGIYNTLSNSELQAILPELSMNRPAVHQIGSEGRLHLRNLAENCLIRPFGDAVLATASPFVQPIIDLMPPRLARGHLALVGDAAGVLRPHSASGITKAADNIFSLAHSLEQESYLPAALVAWEKQQLAELDQHSELGLRLGRGLVSDAPDWSAMSPTDMPGWWEDMLAGVHWYADARA